jgi:hypothetical protein
METALMLFLVLVALVFAYLGATGLKYAIRLQSDSTSWPVATATVIHLVRTGDADRTQVMVSFTTPDGQEIRTDLQSEWIGVVPQVGQRMQVRYDPRSPRAVVEDNALGRGATELLKSIVMLAIGVGGLIGLAKYFIGML